MINNIYHILRGFFFEDSINTQTNKLKFFRHFVYLYELFKIYSEVYFIIVKYVKFTIDQDLCEKRRPLLVDNFTINKPQKV